MLLFRLGIWRLLPLVLTAIASAAPTEWSALDRYQGKLSASELVSRLDALYAPHADWRKWVELGPDAAWIRTDGSEPHRYYRLALRGEDEASPAESPLARPLSAWKIAIDPGHIGGVWGPVERRSFRLGEGPVVQEGDLVLAAARRIAEALRAEGAEAVLVREAPEPVTGERPSDFFLQAFRELARGDELPASEVVRGRADALFYRRSEILARVERVNGSFQPDLVLALHIDAAPWANPDAPAPVLKNGGHVLVNGAYMPAELAVDSTRLALFWRLLEGYDQVELPLALALADAMAAQTGLPPVRYEGAHAAAVGDSGYVWARNLMANRLYAAPVVYLEPWMLNNGSVYAWAALGDYAGEQEIDGQLRKSLPAVYADFVLQGLRARIAAE